MQKTQDIIFNKGNDKFGDLVIDSIGKISDYVSGMLTYVFDKFYYYANDTINSLKIADNKIRIKVDQEHELSTIMEEILVELKYDQSNITECECVPYIVVSDCSDSDVVELYHIKYISKSVIEISNDEEILLYDTMESNVLLNTYSDVSISVVLISMSITLSSLAQEHKKVQVDNNIISLSAYKSKKSLNSNINR